MQFLLRIHCFDKTTATIISYCTSDTVHETTCAQLLRVLILFHPGAAPPPPTAGNTTALTSRGDTDVKLE